jgi:hypothetical protein
MSISSSPTQQKRRISGILAYPGISRNGNLYTERELQRGDGVTVPFYDEHEDFQVGEDGKPTGRILQKAPSGAIRLKWNPELKQLEYDGFVTSPRTIQRIKAGVNKVSLAAEPQYFEPGPDGTRVPRGLRFFSASDVEKPGFPLTTLQMEFLREGLGTRPTMWQYVIEGVNLQVPDEVRAVVLLESQTLEMVESEPLHPDFQKPDPAQMLPGFNLSTNVGSGVMSPSGQLGTRVEPQAPQGVDPMTANFQDPTAGLSGSQTGEPEVHPASPQPGPFVTTMPYQGGQLARPAQALLHSAREAAARKESLELLHSARLSANKRNKQH